MLARKDAALARARQAHRDANGAEIGAWPVAEPQPATRAAAVRSIAVGTDARDAAAGESSETLSQALATLRETGGVGGGGGGAGGASPSALASRFARRVAELEGALDRSRENARALESARAEEERKRRALRTRVARLEKGGGSDVEYLRNVLLRWFMLPASERGNLFPAIAAACAFSPKEMAEINRGEAADDYKS